MNMHEKSSESQLSSKNFLPKASTALEWNSGWKSSKMQVNKTVVNTQERIE